MTLKNNYCIYGTANSPFFSVTFLKIHSFPLTCSSSRRPLRSNSLVYNEIHLFIVGIGPICDKEL